MNQLLFVHDQNQDVDLDFWRIVVPDKSDIKEQIVRNCTVHRTVLTPESNEP